MANFIHRRSFLRQGAASAGGLLGAPLFHIVPSEAVGSQERVAASERITVGMIGTGDHGIGLNLRAMLSRADTQVVAVCDVDGSRLRKAYEMVTQWYAANKPSDTFRGCDQTKEFRKRRDADANGPWHFFDLERDPEETNNLAEDSLPEFRKMKSQLETWITGTQ